MLFCAFEVCLDTQATDMLYTTDENEFSIPWMIVKLRKGISVVAEINLKENINDIVVAKKEIGTVNDVNGKVSDLDVTTRTQHFGGGQFSRQ